jgi:hypothetical protein
MDTLLILLTIYIIPILITWLCAFSLMKKGETIEEFINETEIFDSGFVIPMTIPLINIGVMIYTIIFTICYKFKDWRK